MIRTPQFTLCLGFFFRRIRWIIAFAYIVGGRIVVSFLEEGRFGAGVERGDGGREQGKRGEGRGKMYGIRTVRMALIFGSVGFSVSV